MGIFLFPFHFAQFMNKSVNWSIHAYTTMTGQFVILIKILVCMSAIADLTENILVCCHVKITVSVESLEYSSVLLKWYD